MPTIIITSPDANGHTDLAINGIASRIPHNKSVSVSDAEMEVLNNAELGIPKIKVLEDEKAETEAEPLGGSDPKAGTEGSSIQAPATPAATSNEPNALLTSNQQEEPFKPGDVQLRGEDDKDGADPILASGTEKVGDEGDNSDEQTDDDKFVDRSIATMDGDIAGLNDAAKIDALIAAEQKRTEPRSTLITKLEARKAALAE